MKGHRAQHVCALLSLAAAILAGCAAPPMPPLQFNSQRGYVDFFAERSDISFSVFREEGDAGSKVGSPSRFTTRSGITRIELGPGRYSFRIDVLNHVTGAAPCVEVEVLAAQITPVRIRLLPATRSTPDIAPVAADPVFATDFDVPVRRRMSSLYLVQAAAQPSTAYMAEENTSYHQ